MFEYYAHRLEQVTKESYALTNRRTKYVGGADTSKDITAPDTSGGLTFSISFDELSVYADTPIQLQECDCEDEHVANCPNNPKRKAAVRPK